MKILLLLFAVASSWAQVRVNVGGPLYVDPSGNTWLADTGCTSTSTYNRGAIAIAGTTSDTIYQTGRTATSSLSCTYAVAANTYYYVTLLLAETDSTVTAAGPNARVLNIFINGVEYYKALNVLATSAQFASAYNVTPPPIAVGPDAQITVMVTQQAGQPMLSGLQIITASVTTSGCNPSGTTGKVQASDGSAGCISASLQASSIPVGQTGIGNNNIGVGSSAAMTTGFDNLAIGAAALAANTTGSNNIAIGINSLHSTTSGFENTALGDYSLQSNTTGRENVAIGPSAATLGATTVRNVAIGSSALSDAAQGSDSVAIGTGAMSLGIRSVENIGIGFDALESVTEPGRQNIAIGSGALSSTTTGIGNVAVGRNAGSGGDVSGKSIYIGYQAGQSETGSNKLYIDSSQTGTPFIYGDMGTARSLAIDAALQLTVRSADPGCTVAGDLGKIWMDSTTAANTALKFCLNVASTPTWVTK